VDGPCRGCGRCVETCFAGLSALKREKPSSESNAGAAAVVLPPARLKRSLLIIEKDDFIEESILRIRSYVQVD